MDHQGMPSNTGMGSMTGGVGSPVEPVGSVPPDTVIRGGAVPAVGATSRVPTSPKFVIHARRAAFTTRKRLRLVSPGTMRASSPMSRAASATPVSCRRLLAPVRATT